MTIAMQILVDTAEQKPFEFVGLTTEPTQKTCLGRHPTGLGDYSAEGLQGVCHVERKSVADLQSTLLGWSGGRDRFKQELRNLAEIEHALVVVEGTFNEVLTTAPEYGKKTSAENAQILGGTIVSHMASFDVHWMFADTRKLAELFAFRFLEKCHWKHMQLGGTK